LLALKQHAAGNERKRRELETPSHNCTIIDLSINKCYTLHGNGCIIKFMLLFCHATQLLIFRQMCAAIGIAADKVLFVSVRCDMKNENYKRKNKVSR
jgi:hypothetical protein